MNIIFDMHVNCYLCVVTFLKYGLHTGNRVNHTLIAVIHFELVTMQAKHGIEL